MASGPSRPSNLHRARPFARIIFPAVKSDDSIPFAAYPLFWKPNKNGIAPMRMLSLLFAIVMSGCTGDRLKAEMRPNAVALRAPPVSEQALRTVTVGNAKS